MERNCLGCGQVDDHPRHIVALPDGTDVFWHNDCHARSSSACPHCAAVVDSAGGLQGDELRAHINEHDPAGTVNQLAPSEVAELPSDAPSEG